eukprot:scaffold7364_cov130-Isochrysis_galbana.AAC.5
MGPLPTATACPSRLARPVPRHPAAGPQSHSALLSRRAARSDGLSRRELLVHASAGDELIVRALLDNPALGDDADGVGRADGGQTMGDDHGGALGHEPVDSFLHDVLRLRVER